MKPLITGASGALGHHLVAALAADPAVQPSLLLREPSRLKLALPEAWTTLVGDAQGLAQRPWPAGTTHVVHLAAAWGGPEAWAVNHQATLALARRAAAEGLPFLWLGSASVVHPHGGLDPAAFTLGHDYVRSKAQAALTLASLPGAWALHPGVILGAWPGGPCAHASLGLGRLKPWAGLLRWLRLDGSLGWIHAADLAQLVVAWLARPQALPATAVAAQPPVAVAQVLAALVQASGRRHRGSLDLSPLLPWVPRLAGEAMTPWDRHALALRHHGHPEAWAPERLGLASHHRSLASAIAQGWAAQGLDAPL